jgi:hypothetical protein
MNSQNLKNLFYAWTQNIILKNKNVANVSANFDSQFNKCKYLNPELLKPKTCLLYSMLKLPLNSQ